MSELLVIDEYLTEVLQGDSALVAACGETAASACVHSDVAPEGTKAPFVVFQNLDAHDVRVVGANRVMARADYVVKGICAGFSYGPLETIAARIDALLHDTAATNSRGTVISCVREQEIKYPETSEGRHYRHLGAVFRLQAQE